MDASIFAYPKLHYFTSGNFYTGSHKGMNYMLTPAKDAETEQKTLKIAVWYGPYCSALSEIVAETVLPLTEEGLEQSRAYLAQQYAVFCEQEK